MRSTEHLCSSWRISFQLSTLQISAWFFPHSKSCKRGHCYIEVYLLLKTSKTEQSYRKRKGHPKDATLMCTSKLSSGQQPIFNNECFLAFKHSQITQSMRHNWRRPAIIHPKNQKRLFLYIKEDIYFPFKIMRH